MLQGHWDDVEDFAFVDDDTGISVSRDRRIFIWNLDTGSIDRVLEKHDRDVLSVEYAKGKIYSSGDDMTLRQWDLETGDLLRTWGPFEVETDTCSIDFLYDRVVLGCDDGRIRIFDCNTGESVRQIDAHRSGIKKVAVSPVTGDILSAAYDQRVLVWDATSFELKLELEGHAATWERSFNWAPDGKSILAGTFDGTVLRWGATDGRLLAEIAGDAVPAGNACLNDVSALRNGLTATVSDDGRVRLARLSATGSEWKQSAIPPSGRVLMNAVCLVGSGHSERSDGLLLAGAHDQKLHLFDLVDGRLGEETELVLNEGPINCIRVAREESGSGDAFVACYSGAVVRIALDKDRGAEISQRLSIHDGAVKSVRIHPREQYGVSAAADGSIFSWGFDGEIRFRFAGHTAIVDDVDFDPSGRLLASVSRDFTVNVYDCESGLLRHSVLLGRQSPKSVLFWDRSTIIVGNYWGDLWRVELPQEKVRAFRIAINGISSLSRCGDHIAAVSYDGSLCLVDPADMSVVGRIRAMQQKLDGFENSASFD
ncbi:MAG: WD40 repeat domain-containing protein [Chromatiaceae bacterium]|nr:WD40 repeat domain-containing protein [Chromatiaceae bacterium]